MLKEVYDKPVASSNLALIGGIYINGYDRRWIEKGTEGWDKLKGHLERLGVSSPEK